MVQYLHFRILEFPLMQWYAPEGLAPMWIHNGELELECQAISRIFAEAKAHRAARDTLPDHGHEHSPSNFGGSMLGQWLVQLVSWGIGAPWTKSRERVRNCKHLSLQVWTDVNHQISMYVSSVGVLISSVWCCLDGWGNWLEPTLHGKGINGTWLVAAERRPIHYCTYGTSSSSGVVRFLKPLPGKMQ